MEYGDHKKQIKTGDLLVWSDRSIDGKKKLTSTLIRLFTMSEYCHVGIAWVTGNRIFVIEAVRPIVRIYPLSKLIPFYHVEMGIKVNDAELEVLLSRVGEPYSTIDAIISYFKKPSENAEWQCVELVKYFYSHCNIKFEDAWTPSDFVRKVLESNINNKHYSLVYFDKP